MKYFDELNLGGMDILYVMLIGLSVFVITYLIYPPLIKWLKKKNYVGYDIHKSDRPATAESGGLGLTIGILFGLIMVGIIYPILHREVFVFIITLLTAAFIGWIDDRIQLSSITKIVLMVVTGLPIFLTNYVGFIEIDSPTLPIIGPIRLSIIYPLVIPIIVAIMTNTVNMLEGYNGEGSGTTAVATFFLIICAIIAKSSQGLLFGVPVFFAILAFYKYNKFPAKAFPGDIGTLAIGASVAMIGILGSLEVAMAIAMLTHIFNSFYVLASIHGWIKMKNIKDEIDKPDIWIDKDDMIHASDEDDAPLTLPRLLLAQGKMSEKQLVYQFIVLSIISGIFAILSEIIRQHTLGNINIYVWLCWLIIVCCFGLFIYLVRENPRIRNISIMMVCLLLIGLLLFYVIDLFIIDLFSPEWNWLYAFGLGGFVLVSWYFITIKHFWSTIEKMKKSPSYEPTPKQEKSEKMESEEEFIEK